jgi:hypothetical protein
MRFSTQKNLVFAIPVLVLAQTADLKMGVIYQCPAVQATMEVFSCTGPAAGDSCDVQTAPQGRPAMRGRSTRPQVMALLGICHLQTPAEAQATARGGPVAAPAPAASQVGPGGFKTGDTVRILADGWQEAKVLQVRGNSYFVQMGNGIQVSKIWPMEVRRVGKLTAEDHAVGQYDNRERVQVRINGQWHEGTITGQNLNMYSIKVPGLHGDFDSDSFSTTPENIRISTTPPPPPAQRAAGQAPKPGLASCGSKYDGRWEQVPGGLRIVFRSGNATVSEPPLGASEPYECFMGGGQILFYKAGSFMPVDYLTLLPNNDGTLQSELGALKKMGN